ALSVLVLGAPVSSPRGRVDVITYLYAMFRWKVLHHNPAHIEALRRQVPVIEDEAEKDDVVGQGIRRDYMIGAVRRTFNSRRFEPEELIKDRRKSRLATAPAGPRNGPSTSEAKEHDQGILVQSSPPEKAMSTRVQDDAGAQQ